MSITRQDQYSGVWTYSLASVAFALFAVVAIVDGIASERPVALLWATLCLVIAAANAVYVVWRTERRR